MVTSGCRPVRSSRPASQIQSLCAGIDTRISSAHGHHRHHVANTKPLRRHRYECSAPRRAGRVPCRKYKASAQASILHQDQHQHRHDAGRKYKASAQASIRWRRGTNGRKPSASQIQSLCAGIDTAGVRFGYSIPVSRRKYKASAQASIPGGIRGKHVQHEPVANTKPLRRHRYIRLGGSIRLGTTGRKYKASAQASILLALQLLASQQFTDTFSSGLDCRAVAIMFCPDFVPKSLHCKTRTLPPFFTPPHRSQASSGLHSHPDPTRPRSAGT